VGGQLPGPIGRVVGAVRPAHPVTIDSGGSLGFKWGGESHLCTSSARCGWKGSLQHQHHDQIGRPLRSWAELAVALWALRRIATIPGPPDNRSQPRCLPGRRAARGHLATALWPFPSRHLPGCGAPRSGGLRVPLVQAGAPTWGLQPGRDPGRATEPRSALAGMARQHCGCAAAVWHSNSPAR